MKSACYIAIGSIVLGLGCTDKPKERWRFENERSKVFGNRYPKVTAEDGFQINEIVGPKDLRRFFADQTVAFEGLHALTESDDLFWIGKLRNRPGSPANITRGWMVDYRFSFFNYPLFKRNSDGELSLLSENVKFFRIDALFIAQKDFKACSKGSPIVLGTTGHQIVEIPDHIHKGRGAKKIAGPKKFEAACFPSKGKRVVLWSDTRSRIRSIGSTYYQPGTSELRLTTVVFNKWPFVGNEVVRDSEGVVLKRFSLDLETGESKSVEEGEDGIANTYWGFSQAEDRSLLGFTQQRGIHFCHAKRNPLSCRRVQASIPAVHRMSLSQSSSATNKTGYEAFFGSFSFRTDKETQPGATFKGIIHPSEGSLQNVARISSGHHTVIGIVGSSRKLYVFDSGGFSRVKNSIYLVVPD